MRLYDVGKREVIASFETGQLPFAAMSPDGKRAVISDGLLARVVNLPP